MSYEIGKPMHAVKASVIDDDAFRVLAIPYDAPIPSPHTARGVDRDGEWFSPRTDIKPDWFSVRLVDWHHRTDQRIGAAIIGKATDLLEDDDGWWVTVWLNRQKAEFALVDKLVKQGVQLFGSSETIRNMTKKAATGEILQWPYMYQTLSPLPRNLRSVLRPLKATLDVFKAEGLAPEALFFDDLAQYLDDLATRPSGDLTGEPDAKAGRVLAARNEDRISEARTIIEIEGWHPVRRKRALDLLATVLAELEQTLPDSGAAGAHITTAPGTH